MSKFEIALLLVGVFHTASALVVETHNFRSELMYKLLPFFFGLFEILLSLRYAGVIG